MYDGGGIKNFLFGRCRYYWSVNIILSTAKKKYIKKPKKKQKLNWNPDARNQTWAIRLRVRYRDSYTIAEIFKILLIIISNHMT